ncbi:g2106 [Coccomyxa elongata]
MPNHEPPASIDPLGPFAVLLSAALILVNAAISVRFSLGLHRTLAVASLRCVLQLSILGYVLAPVFHFNTWWLVLLYAGAMLAISSAETVSHPAASYKGMLVHVLGSLSASSAVVMVYALLLVLRPHPRWDAPYAIAVLASVLANALSGVSAGLSSVVQELTLGAQHVEAMLLVGASRWEATRGVVQRSLSAALAPTLSHMSAVGLVTLPSFMSGQLLGGIPPIQVARYQIVVMFLAAAAAGLASVATVLLAVNAVVDQQHRIRGERLRPRTGQSGVATWVQAQTSKGWHAARSEMRRLVTRVRLASRQRASWQPAPQPRSWLGRSALGRRVFGGAAAEDDDVLSISSRLRDVMIGSEDEMESVLSGPLALSDDGHDDSHAPALGPGRRQST